MCRSPIKPGACWVDAELQRCKPGVRIVNCARGGVVVEAALAEALASGQVAGAALDVFENEPPTGSPLLGQANVVLTPHIAGQTHEAQRQVAIDVSEQVLAVLQGRLARYAINTPIIPPKDLEVLDALHRPGRAAGPFPDPVRAGHAGPHGADRAWPHRRVRPELS